MSAPNVTCHFIAGLLATVVLCPLILRPIFAFLTADDNHYSVLLGYTSGVGKMRNCEMRKVKCGIEKCGNGRGMVGKTWNVERVHGESKPAEHGWKTGLENGFKNLGF